MKLLFAFLLLMFSSMGFANGTNIDCGKLPTPKNLIQIGQVAPRIVRAALKTGNLSSVANLMEVSDNNETLARSALNLGLALQQLGNESMIYSVDALVYLTGNSKEQVAARKILDSAVEINDYYLKIQVAMGARLLANVRIFGWNELADALQDYLSTNPQPQVLQRLSSVISNTGKLNQNSGANLCEAIRTLQN